MCVFHLHGFNFDSSSSGDWWIEGHKWGGEPVAEGVWSADDEGEWTSEDITLPDGHYKAYAQQLLPNDPPGGEKKKVFKVRCGEESGTSTPSGATHRRPPPASREHPRR